MRRDMTKAELRRRRPAGHYATALCSAPRLKPIYSDNADDLLNGALKMPTKGSCNARRSHIHESCRLWCACHMFAYGAYQTLISTTSASAFKCKADNGLAYLRSKSDKASSNATEPSAPIAFRAIWGAGLASQSISMRPKLSS